MAKTLSFEDAMARLDDIAKELESGSMTLDKSIEVYEEAIKLIKVCNDKLECAEGKVKILTEMKDGAVTDGDFIGGYED